jgi:hypothetical protein
LICYEKVQWWNEKFFGKWWTKEKIFDEFVVVLRHFGFTKKVLNSIEELSTAFRAFMF